MATEVEVRRTVCNRDCPDVCGLIATIEDGKLISLRGEREHPVTDGFLCFRTSRFPTRQHEIARVTEPLIRRRLSDPYEPANWDETLDLIATKLIAIRDESGPAAILHYRSGGTMGLLASSVPSLFFERFGPVTGKRGDICSGGGDAAHEHDFGVIDTHDFFDLERSKNILLWGKNPYVSNVHLTPMLKDARKRGARVILVDPVRHKSANLADVTILPRPGGDFAMAMGVAAVLFERGHIDPDAPRYCDDFDAFRALVTSRAASSWAVDAEVTVVDLEILADALADRPCAIQVGWGMGRRVNGSAIVRALDSLAGVSGNIGIAGGGVSFCAKRRGAFDTSFLSGAAPRTLSEPLLGQEMLAASDPPIRAVWVTAGNPVAMLPDSATVARAFESLEFVVVADSMLTDTARRAHVVLPTTTLVEDDDLLGSYGNHWIGVSTPVVERPPLVRTDVEIAQMLAEVVDAKAGSAIASELAGDARQWKQRLLRRVEPLGITVERLEKESVRNPFSTDVLFADRTFPTDTGRMKLVTALPPTPDDEPGFPLWMFSNSTAQAQSSQWAVAEPDVVTAVCHPAAAPDFHEGDEVFIESAIGRLRARLAFDDYQRRDIVILPKGGHYDRGTCANALIRARTTDAGEGAAYQDCRVRIRPVS